MTPERIAELRHMGAQTFVAPCSFMYEALDEVERLQAEVARVRAGLEQAIAKNYAERGEVPIAFSTAQRLDAERHGLLCAKDLLDGHDL